jgi:hypothetical protein
MSTTRSLASPESGYAERHAVVPERGLHVIEFVGLLAILAGDAVAFYQVAERAMPTSEEYIVLALVGALSAAATLSMHQAGKARRASRADDTHPGRPWFWLLVGAWLSLGAGTIWFRLASEPSVAAAPATGGFGAPVHTSSVPAEPMAVLLLMLYLVGGLTAFGIGFCMHNPARSAYFRARRVHRRALRSHRWALRLRDRAAREPRVWWPLVGRRPSWIESRPNLSIVPPSAAGPSEQDATLAIVDDLAARREHARDQARAQAAQLRQVARHRLATALAEPARTSGVFTPTTSTDHAVRNH